MISEIIVIPLETSLHSLIVACTDIASLVEGLRLSLLPVEESVRCAVTLFVGRVLETAPVVEGGTWERERGLG
jgi:hypothetical protein